MGASLTCRDCTAPISHQSKTGRCRTCATRASNADPAVQARRRAAIATYWTPDRRAAQAAGLAARNRNPSEERLARLREQGRGLSHYQTPELRARLADPATKAAAARTRRERELSWCPPPLRPLFMTLTKSKRLPAAEARRIVEAEIPGTVEHGRRIVANHDLAARLRHEREKAEAY